MKQILLTGLGILIAVALMAASWFTTVAMVYGSFLLMKHFFA